MRKGASYVPHPVVVTKLTEKYFPHMNGLGLFIRTALRVSVAAADLITTRNNNILDL